MAELTVESVLRDLFAAGAYDEEGDVSMARVVEMANEAGIDLHPNYCCYTYDGHNEDCEKARCAECGHTPCTCDPDYDNLVGK